MKAIIFSKNRGAQLDLLLQSLKANAIDIFKMSDVYVLWTTESEHDMGGFNYNQGYSKCKEWWPEVNWIKEKDFKIDLMNLLPHEHGELVMLFTDDDIMYRRPPMLNWYVPFENPSIFCFSSRLGTNTFIQDPYNSTICIIPDTVTNQPYYFRNWSWVTEPVCSNFGYPFSVDGNIFRQTDLIDLLYMFGDFSNPNGLESRAIDFMNVNRNIIPPQMCCLENSFVVNTPLNRVQNTAENRFGETHGISSDQLETDLIMGKRLSFENMKIDEVVGSHQEMELVYAS